VVHCVQQVACARVACDPPVQPASVVPCHHYQPHPHVHQLLGELHTLQHALQMLRNVMVSSLSCHGVAHLVLQNNRTNLYFNEEHKFSQWNLWNSTYSLALLFILLRYKPTDVN